jgi:hypothetical protein
MIYGDNAKAVERLFGLCGDSTLSLKYVPILNKQRNSLQELVIADAPMGSLNWSPIFILMQQAPETGYSSRPPARWFEPASAG